MDESVNIFVVTIVLESRKLQWFFPFVSLAIFLFFKFNSLVFFLFAHGVGVLIVIIYSMFYSTHLEVRFLLNLHSGTIELKQMCCLIC